MSVIYEAIHSHLLLFKIYQFYINAQLLHFPVHNSIKHPSTFLRDIEFWKDDILSIIQNRFEPENPSISHFISGKFWRQRTTFFIDIKLAEYEIHFNAAYNRVHSLVALFPYRYLRLPANFKVLQMNGRGHTQNTRKNNYCCISPHYIF